MQGVKGVHRRLRRPEHRNPRRLQVLDAGIHPRPPHPRAEQRSRRSGARGYQRLGDRGRIVEGRRGDGDQRRRGAAAGIARGYRLHDRLRRGAVPQDQRQPAAHLRQRFAQLNIAGVVQRRRRQPVVVQPVERHRRRRIAIADHREAAARPVAERHAQAAGKRLRGAEQRTERAHPHRAGARQRCLEGGVVPDHVRRCEPPPGCRVRRRGRVSSPRSASHGRPPARHRGSGADRERPRHTSGHRRCRHRRAGSRAARHD